MEISQALRLLTLTFGMEYRETIIRKSLYKQGAIDGLHFFHNIYHRFIIPTCN